MKITKILSAVAAAAVATAAAERIFVMQAQPLPFLLESIPVCLRQQACGW